jgi:hypothetical protein
MMNVPQNFNFDVRVRERLLRKGVISNADVSSLLNGLSNLESECMVLDLEQPVLIRAKSEVEPEREPVPVAVLPVRSGNTELPPPPPGLIKETYSEPFPGVAYVEEQASKGASQGWSSESASEPSEPASDEATAEAFGSPEPTQSSQPAAVTPAAFAPTETADDDAWGADT